MAAVNWIKQRVLGEIWVFREDWKPDVLEFIEWLGADDAPLSDGAARVKVLMGQGEVLRISAGSDADTPKPSFTPPTEEEWMMEARQKLSVAPGKPLTAEMEKRIRDGWTYYNDCGWTVGTGKGKARRKMVSWKMCCRRWVDRNKGQVFLKNGTREDSNARAGRVDMGDLV
tara:strand:+ start:4536 stop:5048 length:513 start_codon:yes stop_codon:yes gene_type:complete